MRRKIRQNQLIFMTLLTLAAPAVHGKVTTEIINSKIIYNFEIPGINWEETHINLSTYSRIKLLGVQGYEGIVSQVGAPEIPVIRLYVDGPVEVYTDESPEILVQAQQSPLVPVQKPREKTPNFTTHFSFDSSIYDSVSEYPGRGTFEIEPSGSIRGIPRYMVTLYPLSYSPQAKTYKLIKKFKIIAENSNLVPDSRAETMVTIVGPKFATSPSLNLFEEHKRKLGYQIIRLQVSKGEKPESIRTKIKNIYRSANLRFGIIVGDQEDVPGKQSTIISGVTDHYYRAIDTEDYKRDINGPDIGVGRLSAANEEQLAAIIKKIIRYDTGTFEQTGWLNELSWLATDDRWQVAEGTHNYVIQSYTHSKGYQGAFPKPNQSGGDQLYAITHRVDDATTVKTISKGRTIINYSGHGSHVSWAGPSVSQSDVKKIHSTEALPFVISNACITGDYRISESFAETWQRHPYGAIAFWGSMDSSYWDEDDILERRTFDGIFKNQETNFSGITDSALGELWKHYGGKGLSAYYRETYVLFGDPSQNLRYLTPLTPEGQIPSQISTGTTQMSVQFFAANKPLKKARIALTSKIDSTNPFITNYSQPLVGYTDESGFLDISLGDLTLNPGHMILSVSGPNLRTQEFQIDIAE
jgi:hypothetical protein